MSTCLLGILASFSELRMSHTETKPSCEATANLSELAFQAAEKPASFEAFKVQSARDWLWDIKSSTCEGGYPVVTARRYIKDIHLDRVAHGHHLSTIWTHRRYLKLCQPLLLAQT